MTDLAGSACLSPVRRPASSHLSLSLSRAAAASLRPSKDMQTTVCSTTTHAARVTRVLVALTGYPILGLRRCEEVVVVVVCAWWWKDKAPWRSDSDSLARTFVSICTPTRSVSQSLRMEATTPPWSPRPPQPPSLPKHLLRFRRMCELVALVPREQRANYLAVDQDNSCGAIDRLPLLLVACIVFHGVLCVLVVVA